MSGRGASVAFALQGRPGPGVGGEGEGESFITGRSQTRNQAGKGNVDGKAGGAEYVGAWGP